MDSSVCKYVQYILETAFPSLLKNGMTIKTVYGYIPNVRFDIYFFCIFKCICHFSRTYYLCIQVSSKDIKYIPISNVRCNCPLKDNREKKVELELK